MIEIATLRPSDVGRGVVYAPRVGQREDGVITSWNDRYVFVRYGVQTQSKATDPADLTFLRDAKTVAPCTDPHGAGDGFGGSDYE